VVTEEVTAPDTSQEAHNAAFAQIRREKEEIAKQHQEIQNQMAKQQAILNAYAIQNGTTPDELMKQMELKALEKEAARQNVPVEYLQRVQTMEQEFQQMQIKNEVMAYQTNMSNLANTHDIKSEELSTFVSAMEVQFGPELLRATPEQ
jgi:hypothetical protein